MQSVGEMSCERIATCAATGIPIPQSRQSTSNVQRGIRFSNVRAIFASLTGRWTLNAFSLALATSRILCNRCDRKSVRRGFLLFRGFRVATLSFMPWLRVRKKTIFRSPIFWIGATVVLLLAIGAASLGPWAKRYYDRRSANHKVERAEGYRAKGDYKHAVLDARSALEIDPRNVEAMR